MCGICGIVGFRDQFQVDESTVTRMRDTMLHRGPDDGGSWCEPSERAALGHRRLSIVDLSECGHQPMSNEDGTVWIAFNGEIYNHAILREELIAKGHTYKSKTDTETIIHLYEEEGHRCVERLHGMFAFAIWDSKKRELFIARDRLGVKPLYYARPEGGMVFGSEIKALLKHPSITADLDEESFNHYLTFVSTPAPGTMFKGVMKLAPAERMTIRADGSSSSDIYWTPLSGERTREVAQMSEKEIQERLVEILRESIGERMMSDVPYGVFLSGGVDSSTNVALMSELTPDPVRTFSVGFKEHEQYNEMEYARQIAKQFKTDHHEIVIDWDDYLGFLPEMVHHQDEPIADWVCVPLHFVSKLARENDTIVVQVGEGSDEIFHGYQAYVDQARFHRRYWAPFQKVPRPLRMAASNMFTAASQATGRLPHHAQYLRDSAEGRLPFWGGAIAYQGTLKEEIYASSNGHADSYEIVERLWAEAERELPGADLLQKMSYLELKQRLAELLLMRVDKMTMATSVEGREPFLDHELVEFAMAIPAHMKVRDGEGKWILKKAVEGILPQNIIWRKKQGFGAPVAEWYRGDLGKQTQEQIRKSALAERGLLDYDRIDRMWDEHRAGKGAWSFQLFNLYNVSAWYDYWVAGRSDG